MQSRFLLWFDCNRKDDQQIRVRKQLVIPSENLDTFITFVIQRIGGTLMAIELDEDTKNIVKSRNLKCKCIVYDAVNRTTASNIENETLEEGYFGTLLDLTLLKASDASTHSKVDVRDDLVQDPCSSRASIEMDEDILMLIPMNCRFSKSLKSSLIKTGHDFNTNPYYFSSTCGNYIYSKGYFQFLSDNGLFSVSLVYRRKQYWFKNFNESFRLTHSCTEESRGPEYFLLGVYIGSNVEGSSLQRNHVMEVLQKNNINFSEKCKEDLLEKDLNLNNCKIKKSLKTVEKSLICQKFSKCRFNLDKNKYILCYE